MIFKCNKTKKITYKYLKKRKTKNKPESDLYFCDATGSILVYDWSLLDTYTLTSSVDISYLSLSGDKSRYNSLLYLDK